MLNSILSPFNSVIAPPLAPLLNPPKQTPVEIIIDPEDSEFIVLEQKVEYPKLQELIEQLHQLARFPASADPEKIAQLLPRLNEALQREPCFLLEHYQVRILQLKEMLSRATSLPNGERLCSVLKQHLIHAEHAASTLFRDSATPVQDSLWPLYERILHLPTLEPDYFGIAIAVLREQLRHAIATPLIEQLQELLPKLLPPAHYLWGQKEPFTVGLEKLEDSKRASLVLLHRLKQAPEGHIKTFLEPMETIYETYRSYQEAFNKASDQKKLALCVPKAQLSGPGLGFFSLEQSVAYTLVGRNERGQHCKKNAVGTHAVHCEAGVFYKANSDNRQTYIHPEMEFAVYALYQRLGLQGVAPTALMKISHLFFEGQTDPQGRTLQAGYGVDGISLQDLLDIANVIPMLTASLGKERGKEAFLWLMKEDWQQDFVHKYPKFCPKKLSTLSCEGAARRLLNGFKTLFEKRAPTKRCLEFSNLDSLDEIEKKFFSHLSCDSAELLVGCLALLKRYSGLALTASKDKQRLAPSGVRPISYEELIHLQHSMKKIKALFPNHSAEQLLAELPQLMGCLNPINFSTHFVATLLTNPCDHCVNNLMVTLVRNEQGGVRSFSLIGIDNDRAFTSCEGSIRTMLYLLESMNAPFDSTVAKQFLGVTPEEFVLDWLIALEEQNQSYDRWQQRGVVIEDGLDIPLKTDSSLIADVYTKAKQLREILETSPYPTHWEILKKLQPKLAKVYEKALNLGDNPMMAYSEVEGLFRKDNLFPPSFEEEPAAFISPKMAALKFLESLNLSSFPIKQQVSLIGKAMHTFPSSANELRLPGDPADPSSRIIFFLVAVTEGHCALVARLLEEEKKSCLEKEEQETSSLIDVRNDEEQTALLLACLRLDLRMIQLLIHYKADPNVCDIIGQQTFALCLKHFPELPGQAATVIRFLADQPTFLLNAANKLLGWSLLHYLVQVAETAPEEAEPLIAYLIKKGANPDLVDNEGKSPLDYAIALGQERSVEQLIRLGAGRTLNVEAACTFFSSRPHLRKTFAILTRHSLLLRWHLALDILRDADCQGTNLSLKGARLGEIDLPPVLTQDLLDATGNIKKPKDQYGRRNVHRLALTDEHELFFKQDPEMPGVEYAINKLFELLIGHGTSFTDLAKLTLPNGKSYPVLISQAIQGENLDDVLSDPVKAKQLEKLDPLFFSELLLASLLVNFEDAKPDNFILEKLPGHTYRLVGIDNDHAFVPPLVKEGGTIVQVKCILYCLDLMKQPIHPRARERFLSFSPERMLRLWLNLLIEQNQRYCNLFLKKERAKLFKKTKQNEGSVISIPLKKGAMADIYQKFQRLQIALKESPHLTGMELLRLVTPPLGIRYEEALHAHNDPLARFLSLTKTQYSIAVDGRCQTLVDSRQMLRSMSIPEKSAWNELAEQCPALALQELDSLQREIETSAQQLSQIRTALQNGDVAPFLELQLDTVREKVVNGIAGAFEGINFKMMQIDGVPDQKKQKEVLSTILTGNYRSLRLNGCTVFGSAALERLLRYSPQLLSLELRECPAVTKDVLIQLAQARYLSRLRLNALPQLLGQISLLHPRLRRLEIVKCQGLQQVTISDTLKSLSIDACWNLSTVQARNYKEFMPFGLRLSHETPKDFVLQTLHLKACPKLQPWWRMFQDWLQASPTHEICLKKVPPFPEQDNLKDQSFVIKAVLQRPEAREMLAALYNAYQKGKGKSLVSSFLEGYQAKKQLLKRLDLSKCSVIIDDELLQTLAQARPKLISINLSHCKQITDAGLEQLAQNCPRLTSINLKHCSEITDAGLQQLAQNCHNLTSINLWGCKLTDRGLQQLAQNCPNLTYINLSFCNVGLHLLALHCDNLAFVDLWYCKQITDAGLKTLAQNCPNLTYIKLSECKQVTDIGLKQLAQHCPNLTYVNLGGTQITDVGLQQLAQHRPRLTSVKLHGCNITDAGLQQLAQNCRDLTSVNLQYCHKITNEGLQQLALHCKSLTSIKLSCKERLQQLALHCPKLTSVELNAYDGEVTNEDLQTLAQRCRNLTSFTLWGCDKITDSGLQQLAQNCHNLTSVRLGGCKQITQAGLQQLAQRCTKLASVGLWYAKQITESSKNILKTRYPHINFSIYRY